MDEFNLISGVYITFFAGFLAISLWEKTDPAKLFGTVDDLFVEETSLLRTPPSLNIIVCYKIYRFELKLPNWRRASSSRLKFFLGAKLVSPQQALIEHICKSI